MGNLSSPARKLKHQLSSPPPPAKQVVLGEIKRSSAEKRWVAVRLGIPLLSVVKTRIIFLFQEKLN
jgi:hypothetical protein